MKQNNRRWAIAAILVFTAAAVFLFQDVIFAADKRILSLGGDGCKNIYAYLYQILYGKGWWFEGMNYPYGEHIVFTDGQPAVSLTLSWLHRHTGLTPEAALAILYYLMAFSFVLGMWFTYRLLVHFRVHPALAIAASVLILGLSPQVFRIVGHYPLSYSSFLPMLFYGSLRYYETERWPYLVWLYVLCVVYAFLHMYFLGMGLLWMLSYAGGYLIVVRGRPGRKWRHVLLYGGAVAAAVVTVQGIIAVTDPVRDRPVYPFVASVQRPLWDLCTSGFSPIWQRFRESGIVDSVKEDPEGAAYLGFVLMILLPAGLVRWIVKLARRKADPEPAFPYIWIFVALSTLVFAMSLSTLWDIGFLKNLLRPLRQFRAPERFSWIFYYVMSVYAAVLLHRICAAWLRKGRAYRIAAVLLAVTILGIWSAEANGNRLFVRQRAGEWRGNYDFFFARDRRGWADFLREHGRKAADFQGILVIPFVHVGSEKIWPGEVDSYSMTHAFMAAIQLHLPIMDVYMSRSSWSQTFDQVKTGAGLYARKPVLEQLASDKPLLLLHLRSYAATPDDQLLFDHSELLGEQDECMMYAFYPKRFLAWQRAQLDSVRAVLERQVSADSVRSAYPVFLEHFDARPAKERIAGAGAMPAISATDSLLLSWRLPVPADTVQYEFSAWIRVPDKGPQQPYFTLYFLGADGKELGNLNVFGKYSLDNAPGPWFRTSAFFAIPAGTQRLEAHIFNPDGDSYSFMDELLIRPADATVLSKTGDGRYLVNNHLLK